MPPQNQWYSSNPVFHLNFWDNHYLRTGYYDVNDYAGGGYSAGDVLMFANLDLSRISTWDRPTYSISITKWNAAVQGLNTIYFYVDDCNGNVGGAIGTWSWSFNKDTVAPNAPTNVISTTHNPYTWSTIRQISVSWTAATDNSPGSGISGYCINWAHNARDPGNVVNCTGTSAMSPDLADANNWYFNIKARDNVGLWSSVVSIGPFWIDNSVPTISGLSSSSHVIDEWSSNAEVTVSWTGSDGTGSGIAGYNTRWTRMPTDPGTANITTTLTEDKSPHLEDGTWYFNIRALDQSGLWCNNISIGPFKIDRTPATLSSPTSSSHVAFKATRLQTITVSWLTADDHGGSGIL
ncbi:MAG: hypothetical protein Q6365_017210, partial [Candidatus Sigynarchaeota archaeon]